MKNLIQKIQDYSAKRSAVISFSPNGRIDTDDVIVSASQFMELIGAAANDNSEGFAVTLDALGYSSLAHVLGRAFDQAANGKGKERHANELPFDQQPMQTIAQAHGVGFLTGQAAKKSQEALGLPHDAKIRELLGAINYLAGAVIFLESKPRTISVMKTSAVGRTGESSSSIGGPYSDSKRQAMKDGACKADSLGDVCVSCRPNGPCKAVARD
jgi:hypothetical protein